MIEIEGVYDSIVDGGEGVPACVVGVAPPVGEMFVGVGATEVVAEVGDDGVSEGSGIRHDDQTILIYPGEHNFPIRKASCHTGDSNPPHMWYKLHREFWVLCFRGPEIEFNGAG